LGSRTPGLRDRSFAIRARLCSRRERCWPGWGRYEMSAAQAGVGLPEKPRGRAFRTASGRGCLGGWRGTDRARGASHRGPSRHAIRNAGPRSVVESSAAPSYVRGVPRAALCDTPRPRPGCGSGRHPHSGCWDMGCARGGNASPRQRSPAPTPRPPGRPERSRGEAPPSALPTPWREYRTARRRRCSWRRRDSAPVKVQD
jgi:hypothetical protein